jgi:acetyl-CoA carboxylase alpha subunit
VGGGDANKLCNAISKTQPTTGEAIAQPLGELRGLDPDAIRKQRRQKFLDIGRKLG